MTEKQRRFCDEYLIDCNATQAAIRAGYSTKTAKQIGQQNLTKLDLQEYIQKRMEEKESELIASQDEVLKYLTSVMRREMTENVVVTIANKVSRYEPDANGTMRKVTIETEEPRVVEIPARLSDANKAAELLGKRYGLFKDSVSLDGVVPIVISGGNDLED